MSVHLCVGHRHHWRPNRSCKCGAVLCEWGSIGLNRECRRAAVSFTTQNSTTEGARLCGRHARKIGFLAGLISEWRARA
jgi:hypothetical protein